jgi:hypothetical protein
MQLGVVGFLSRNEAVSRCWLAVSVLEVCWQRSVSQFTWAARNWSRRLGVVESCKSHSHHQMGSVRAGTELQAGRLKGVGAMGAGKGYSDYVSNYE